MIKTIKYICIVLIALIFIALIIPIPIDKIYDAVEIKLDDLDYCVDRQVKINGKYHINLFTNDTFEGQLIVSGYELTEEKMSRVVFLDDGYPLEYTYTLDSMAGNYVAQGTFFLGRIYAKPFFRKLAITVYNESVKNSGNLETEGTRGWNNQNGFCIVPNTNSREQAIKILIENKIIYESDN